MRVYYWLFFPFAYKWMIQLIVLLQVNLLLLHQGLHQFFLEELSVIERALASSVNTRCKTKDLVESSLENSSTIVVNQVQAIIEDPLMLNVDKTQALIEDLECWSSSLKELLTSELLALNLSETHIQQITAQACVDHLQKYRTITVKMMK